MPQMLINVNGDRTTKEGGPTKQRFVCRLNTLCTLPPILHGSCAIMVRARKEIVAHRVILFVYLLCRAWLWLV